MIRNCGIIATLSGDGFSVGVNRRKGRVLGKSGKNDVNFFSKYFRAQRVDVVARRCAWFRVGRKGIPCRRAAEITVAL
jgi:hypothetical protein